MDIHGPGQDEASQDETRLACGAPLFLRASSKRHFVWEFQQVDCHPKPAEMTYFRHSGFFLSWTYVSRFALSVVLGFPQMLLLPRAVLRDSPALPGCAAERVQSGHVMSTDRPRASTFRICARIEEAQQLLGNVTTSMPCQERKMLIYLALSFRGVHSLWNGSTALFGKE